MNVTWPGIKPKSGIVSWGGWPDDVREQIRRWNRTGKLSFLYLRPSTFFGQRAHLCSECCELFEPQSTVSVFDEKFVQWTGLPDRVRRGRIFCDLCLIEKARLSAANEPSPKGQA
jgi:hypothetical protein